MKGLFVVCVLELQGWIQDFSKGVTNHCLLTKMCKLGACFLYFSYVLAQNRGGGG